MFRVTICTSQGLGAAGAGSAELQPATKTTAPAPAARPARASAKSLRDQGASFGGGTMDSICIPTGAKTQISLAGVQALGGALHLACLRKAGGVRRPQGPAPGKPRASPL